MLKFFLFLKIDYWINHENKFHWLRHNSDSFPTLEESFPGGVIEQLLLLNNFRTSTVTNVNYLESYFVYFIGQSEFF
jgi:hypothetical protein